MEFAKSEIEVIEATITEHAEAQVRELADLELALVGGGTGDIVLY